MLRFSRCVTQRRVSRVCHERKAGECCVRKAFSVKTSESQLGEDTCHTPAKPKSRADGVGGGLRDPWGRGPKVMDGTPPSPECGFRGVDMCTGRRDRLRGRPGPEGREGDPSVQPG